MLPGVVTTSEADVDGGVWASRVTIKGFSPQDFLHQNLAYGESSAQVTMSIESNHILYTHVCMYIHDYVRMYVCNVVCAVRMSMYVNVWYVYVCAY